MNPEIIPYTLEDILSCKDFDDKIINKDLHSLNKWISNNDELKMVGNRTIYKYQFRELLKCPRDIKNYKTIYDIFNDNEEQKLWEQTLKRRTNKNHITPCDVYECFRINKGCVAIFKPSNAKYIYEKYKPTSILDPTAGWGGRLLAAGLLNIKYTGFDTNTDLKRGYDKMIDDINLKNVNMIYENSLSYDFSKLDYDFVLTSPPYYNLELYKHMKPFENKEYFFDEFLIPLMNKCFDNMNNNGKMCFNFPNDYYDTIIKKGFRECDIKEKFKQRRKNGKDKNQDYIFIWIKTI